MTRRPSRSERQAGTDAGASVPAPEHIPASADPTSADAWRGPTDMGTVGPRPLHVTAPCLCGCRGWAVVDVTNHTPAGTYRDSWDAARVASALNRHACPPVGDAICCDGCGLPVVTFGAVA